MPTPGVSNLSQTLDWPACEHVISTAFQHETDTQGGKGPNGPTADSGRTADDDESRLTQLPPVPALDLGLTIRPSDHQTVECRNSWPCPIVAGTTIAGATIKPT